MGSGEPASKPFSKQLAPDPRRRKLLEVTIGVTIHFDENLLGVELSVIANVSNSDGKSSQPENSMITISS